MNLKRFLDSIQFKNHPWCIIFGRWRVQHSFFCKLHLYLAHHWIVHHPNDTLECAVESIGFSWVGGNGLRFAWLLQIEAWVVTAKLKGTTLLFMDCGHGVSAYRLGGKPVCTAARSLTTRPSRQLVALDVQHPQQEPCGTWHPFICASHLTHQW